MKKEFYQSKSVWAGALLMLSAVIKALGQGAIQPEDVTTFLTGAGIVGLRTAINS